jgi:phosphatidate cytidylyltransferase
VVLIMLGAGAWEWARLNGGSAGINWLAGLGCVLACVLSWSAGWLVRPLPVLWLAVGFGWVLLGAMLLSRGVAQWHTIPQTARLLGGLVALWLAWLAMAQARVVGVNFLFSILALVWVADIFAYFSGRTWGGRLCRYKLAPSISPGKTWEGVWGGMAGVLLLAAAWIAVDAAAATTVPSIFSELARRGSLFVLSVVLFLTSMSVLGDLVESLIKRSAGVKDSSGLLPGHGGVLDRLDALIPSLPLAMMVHSLGAL